MAEISNRKRHDRQPLKDSGTGSLPSAKADRKKRQSDLLDDALKETFPASDPVSVVRLK